MFNSNKIVLILICLLFIFSLALPVFAQQFAESPDLQLQVPLFGYSHAKDIGEYITKVYTASLYIIVPVIIVVIIFSGALWILAGGDKGLIQKAKGRMIHGLLGLGIAFFSYILLSLVGLTQVTAPQVEYIGREEGGDIIIENNVPKHAPTAQTGSYNTMACPNIDGGELEIEVFFTNYYKPAYEDKGLYQSFWCNIGMQCSCPGNRKGSPPDGPAMCTTSSGKRWKACSNFDSSTPYCTNTASGNPAKQNYTVAADTVKRNGELPGGSTWKATHKGCYMVGCKFTIKGDPSGRTYLMDDRGGAIRSRHLDYFAGFGADALRNSPVSGKKIIILDKASCDPT